MANMKELNLRQIMQDIKPKGYQAQTPEIEIRRYDRFRENSGNSGNSGSNYSAIGNTNYGFMQTASRNRKKESYSSSDSDYNSRNSNYRKAA